MLKCAMKSTTRRPPAASSSRSRAIASSGTRRTPPAAYDNLGQRLLHETDLAVLSETFRALGDATRLRILDALSKVELCVGDLAELIGLSESAVSHQLRLLRGLRLVRSRRDGRRVFYALDDRHVLDLFRQGLAHVGESGPRGSRIPRPPAPGRSALNAQRGAPRLDDEVDGGVRPGRRWE